VLRFCFDAVDESVEKRQGLAADVFRSQTDKLIRTNARTSVVDAMDTTDTTTVTTKPTPVIGAVAIATPMTLVEAVTRGTSTMGSLVGQTVTRAFAVTGMTGTTGPASYVWIVNEMSRGATVDVKTEAFVTRYHAVI